MTYTPRRMALIVASANFMAALDGTVIVMALPQMARGFGIQPVDLSIGITVYILVTAVFLPISTWVADRLGARTVFAAAIVGFTLASVLCGLSQNLWQFVGARALQACAGALMTPVGNLVLLRSTEKRDFVTMVAISTTPALVAPVIGPPIGGFLISFLSWQWIFFLNIPIGLLGTLLVLRFIPNLRGGTPRKFDHLGFGLTAVALAALIYGLDRLGAEHADRRLAAGLIALGLGVGWAALRHARHHPHPLIPLTALGIPTFSITSVSGGALIKIAFIAANFILPLLFQIGLGMSAFRAGILLLGYNGGDLLLKAVANRILRRTGFRTALAVSTCLTALSIAACAGFGLSTPWALIFGILVASGMFRSVMFTGLVSLTFADVPAAEIGGATVLSNVLNSVTGALAISLSAIVLNESAAWRGGDHLTIADCRVGLILMACVCLAAVAWFLRLPKDAGAEVSGHRTPSLEA